jgi:hypothetical protein
MVKEKQISISIPVDTYTKLASLGDFYKVDIKKLINDILCVIGVNTNLITYTNNEYKWPLDTTFVFENLLEAGYHSRDLFNAILERLGVKGLFILDDFEVKLDEMYFLFNYLALETSNLFVDSFSVEMESGGMNIATDSFIDIKNLDGKALSKLEKIVKKIDAMDYPLPDELSDLELSTEIEKEDEYWRLYFRYQSSFEYTPEISSISKFIEKIFKKAGIISSKRRKT